MSHLTVLFKDETQPIAYPVSSFQTWKPVNNLDKVIMENNGSRLIQKAVLNNISTPNNCFPCIPGWFFTLSQH